MFGISGEHLLVLAVVLLIFGPKRLPDLGSSLGKTLRNFKEAMNNAGSDEPQRTSIPQAPVQQVSVKAPVAEEATIVSPAVAAASTQNVEVKQNVNV